MSGPQARGRRRQIDSLLPFPVTTASLLSQRWAPSRLCRSGHRRSLRLNGHSHGRHPHISPQLLSSSILHRLVRLHVVVLVTSHRLRRLLRLRCP